MIRFIGAQPDYNKMDPDRQLGMLRVIAGRLSDPSSAWLYNAVTSYLDLIEEAITGRSTTTVTLRPATPADSEFCFQLHKAAMRNYVDAIWGWDDQVQRDFHDRGFSPGRWQIITACGIDVGILDVEYLPAEIYLARIEILPDHQGDGIGTRFISALIDEAERKGQDLGLYVLTVNRRPRALYQRLGHGRSSARHGENNIKITMRSARRAGEASIT